MSNNCANIDHVNRTIINLIQQQLEIRQKYRYIYIVIMIRFFTDNPIVNQ